MNNNKDNHTVFVVKMVKIFTLCYFSPNHIEIINFGSHKLKESPNYDTGVCNI